MEGPPLGFSSVEDKSMPPSLPTSLPNSSMSADAELCYSCKIATPKYKCPLCLALTCSVACVKLHKESTGCSGVRNPVVEATLNQMDESILLRDYRLLETVRSQLDKGFRDRSLHHLQSEAFNVGRRGRRQQGNANRGPDPLREDPTGRYNKHLDKNIPAIKGGVLGGVGKCRVRIPNYRNPQYHGSSVELCRSDVPPMLRKLRHEVRQRGAQLVFMPRGMSRHMANTTHYVNRIKAIKWHVRLEFLHADVFFEDTVDERLSVGRIIAKFVNTYLDTLKPQSLTKHQQPHKLRHLEQTSKDSYDDAWSEDKCDADAAGSDNFTNITNQQSNETSQSDVDKSNNFNEVMNEISSTANKVFSISNKLDSPFTLDNEMKDGSSLNHLSVLPNSSDDQQASATILSAEQTDQMEFYRAAGLGDLAVVCKNENFDDNERYRSFDISESLQENLKGLRIVEYPILIIVRKDHIYEFLSPSDQRKDPELDMILNAPQQRSASVEADVTVPMPASMSYFNADDYMDDEM